MKTLILLLLMTSVCWADDNYVDPDLIKDQCDIERDSHLPLTYFYKKYCSSTDDNKLSVTITKGGEGTTKYGTLKDFFEAKGFETKPYGIEHISIRQGDHEVLYVGGIDDYKGMISDKYNVKVSCPDGYVLKYYLYCNKDYTEICKDAKYTDAELKCVKEKK